MRAFPKSLFRALAALLALPSAAIAADMGAPAPAALYSPEPIAAQPVWSGFEVRGGAFAHGVGSREKNTVDVGLEFVSPYLIRPTLDAWWTFLVPRAYLGGMLNTGGRTSAVRGGALWTFPLIGGFFAEAFFGGAINNGSIEGDATHSALGSHILFDAGGSIGYRFNERWIVLARFDHYSNGKTAFGTNFDRNVGVNNYGLMVGYTF